MGKCPNLFEMAWIYRHFTTGQSPYFKYRRKVTNRGKTDVFSKPLKRRIRMGYTCMIYETKFKGTWESWIISY